MLLCYCVTVLPFRVIVMEKMCCGRGQRLGKYCVAESDESMNAVTDKMTCAVNGELCCFSWS